MNNRSDKKGEGVANGTPVGGVGNAPLKQNKKAKNTKTVKASVDGADSTTTDIAKFFHAPSQKNIDVSRRLLSKQFSFFDDEAKTTCPIGGVSVNIDYLQCTGLIPIDSETDRNLSHKLNLLLSLLTQYFGTLVDQKKSMVNGKWKYQNYYKSNHGVIFAYGFFKEGLRYYIQISGIPIRMMRIRDWKSLITNLYKKYHGSLTRIDICTDDYKQRVTGRKLLSVIERGDVARAFNYKYIGSGVAGVGDEVTIYLGSNRKQLYHYNAEHLHGLPAYRFESRLREDKARIIGKSIADFDDQEENQNLTDDELMEALLRWLGSVCLGCVEFLHRDGHRGNSLGQYKRYDFWQSLIDDVGTTTHIPNPKKHLDVIQFCTKSFKWLAKGGALKRLALLGAALGNEVFTKYSSEEMLQASFCFDDHDLDWMTGVKELFDSPDLVDVKSKLQLINYLKFT